MFDITPHCQPRHSDKLRFAAILGCFLLAIGCVGAPTLAQAQARSQPVYDFGGTLIDYKDYPFPVVPAGELWRPELGHTDITAFVPAGLTASFPQAAKEVVDRAAALVSAGDGAAAIALLTRNLALIPEGRGEQNIGNIYAAGSGGVPADTAQATIWYERAAPLNPSVYNWLGANAADDQTRLHIWSVGLSRGCLNCAASLINAKITRPKTRQEIRLWGRSNPNITVNLVPIDLRISYAMVAIDMGHGGGPNLLTEVLQDMVYPSDRAKMPQWVQDLYADLARERSGAVGGENVVTTGVLAWVVYPKLRSGLVPGRFALAAQQVENQEWQAAANTLVFSTEGGRYLPPLINAFMDRLPADSTVMGAVANNSLAVRAAHWGDPTHAAAAALILNEGYKIFYHDGERWTESGIRQPRTSQTYAAVARANGLMWREVATQISAAAAVVSSESAATQARTCLTTARNSPTRTLLTWLNCRSDTYRAWATTDEVDFGVLDDQGFEALLSAASAEYQAEYDRRVSGAADRITANQARRENPRYDFGNARITASGDLQRQNEAFARANPQNFRNMPNHYRQVEEWYRAFDRQRDRVASGAARDLRDGQVVTGSTRACAVWSLRVMPFCKGA